MQPMTGNSRSKDEFAAPPGHSLTQYAKWAWGSTCRFRSEIVLTKAMSPTGK